MKKILKTVGSLRLTVIVVLAIATISVYGTFLQMEEAMSTVYRSPFFISLLILFGINLFACTVLRLRFKLLQAGFLATHIGVLVILGGAIIGQTTGMKGSVNIMNGETIAACYERKNVSFEKNSAIIESQISAIGGEIIKNNGREITVQVPRKTAHELLRHIGSKMPYDIVKTNAESAIILFAPGIQIVKKPLPFSVRLDRFRIDYYNHGNLHITDRSQKLLDTIPAQQGENISIKGYQIKINGFYPNFIFDSETRSATTRNHIPENPTLEVSILKNGDEKEEKLWVFSVYPGMYESMRRDKPKLPFLLHFRFKERVKSYVSDITLFDDKGNEIKKAAVKVNHPLSYWGYTIYQTSYDRTALRYSGLQIVSDPGLWIAYIGFALLVGGVFFIAYLKPYLRKQKPIKFVQADSSTPEASSIPLAPESDRPSNAYEDEKPPDQHLD